MSLELRDLTPEAIDYVLAHLSPADHAELEAAQLADPAAVFHAAAQAAAVSGAFYEDDECVCVFGCNASAEPGVGIPWMIGTDRARLCGVPAAVVSPRMVERMRKHFPVLRNWVHREHTRAIRWLNWLGFRIRREPIGPGGAFYEFTMGAADV